MTNIFSILLSGLIFFQSFNVNFNGYYKLKIMIEHFDYHQENFGNNITDFVNIHYSDDKIFHSDDHEHKDEHENLPFKKENKTSQNTPIVFIINKSIIKINNDDFLESSIIFFYKEMYSKFEKTNIFQPPKH